VKWKRIDRPIRRISSGGMDKDKDAAKRAGERTPAPSKDDREARLAAALRANLRRRKAAPRKPAPETDT
jgi:hypothetical protein